MTNREYKCVDYKRLILAIIRHDIDGGKNIYSQKELSLRKVYKSKMACFCSSEIDCYLPSEVIDARLSINKDCITSISNLWVSPHCKMPRDLFRNSGYKLVRDRNNADALISPAIALDDYHTLTATIVAQDSSTDTLYLFRVTGGSNELRSKCEDRLNDNLWEDITGYLSERYGLEVLHSNLGDEITVEFLPKIDDWKEILVNNNPNYISEFSIQMQYPVTISVESLQMWKHISDRELLAKTVSMSDWKYYPVTMMFFLNFECPDDLRYYGGSSMELMLQHLEYDAYAPIDRCLEGRIVSPKDWNMLQDYIAAELNIPETGGFVDPNKYSFLKEFSSALKQKLAVKPIKITQPMVYDDICSLA